VLPLDVLVKHLGDFLIVHGYLRLIISV